MGNANKISRRHLLRNAAAIAAAGAVESGVLPCFSSASKLIR